MHLHYETAVKTVTQIPDLNLALMSLCLMFDSAPGPFEWGVVSETICDQINKIKQKDDLQPEQLFGEKPTLGPAPSIS